MCGWESRDLRDLIEARWTGMDGAEFERERALLGDLDDLEVASTTARVPAGRRRSGRDVLALLDEMRRVDPAEPLWRGVRSKRSATDHVVVDFRDPVEPRLKPIGEVAVACHLYDEEISAGVLSGDGPAG